MWAGTGGRGAGWCWGGPNHLYVLVLVCSRRRPLCLHFFQMALPLPRSTFVPAAPHLRSASIGTAGPNPLYCLIRNSGSQPPVFPHEKRLVETFGLA